MQILVVDDEPAVRDSLDRALRLEGYEVGLAADGAEALETLTDETPDAIVLDLMMPRVDGLEVCRRMRAAGDRTPVLVLTARDGVSDRVQREQQTAEGGVDVAGGEHEADDRGADGHVGRAEGGAGSEHLTEPL